MSRLWGLEQVQSKYIVNSANIMQLLHQNFKYLVMSVKLVRIQTLKKESKVLRDVWEGWFHTQRLC